MMEEGDTAGSIPDLIVGPQFNPEHGFTVLRGVLHVIFMSLHIPLNASGWTDAAVI